MAKTAPGAVALARSRSVENSGREILSGRANSGIYGACAFRGRCAQIKSEPDPTRLRTKVSGNRRGVTHPRAALPRRGFGGEDNETKRRRRRRKRGVDTRAAAAAAGARARAARGTGVNWNHVDPVGVNNERP